MANDEVCENSLIQVVPVGDRSHEETCPTPKLSHKKMSITSHSVSVRSVASFLNRRLSRELKF